MDKLSEMYKTCRAYQSQIIHYNIGFKEQTAKDILFALHCEIAEIAQLIQWKDWKPAKDITYKDLKALTIEITDVIFFIFELCTTLGISMEDLTESFYKKLSVNKQRHTIKREDF